MSERQKVIYLDHIYDEKGKYIHTNKIFKLPVIINSDIGFELMFGFSYPIERGTSKLGLKEVSINHNKSK